MAKRSYNRRSEEDRIRELEQRIALIRERMEKKSRKDLPVLRELKKVRRVLRSFASTAHQHARPDIGNMVEAFSAGLERQVSQLPDEPRRRGRHDADGEA